MKCVSGTFNGTGADLNVGIGFIPDDVLLVNLEGTDEVSVRWLKNMRSAEQVAGLQLSASTTSPLTVGTGISPYRGGESFSSAQTAYLSEETPGDKRTAGTGADIDTWTLGSSANKTGNWNAECNTDYIGEGSQIVIQETATGKIKEVVITALTSNGEQANEVTLSEAVASGKILKIGPMYDYTGVSANEITKAGFTVANTTVNVSGNMCMFVAYQYD